MTRMRLTFMHNMLIELVILSVKIHKFTSKKMIPRNLLSCIIFSFISLLLLIQIRNIMIYILYIVNIVQ